jgi:hypothetical protein
MIAAAGAGEHQRRAGPAADQGDPAAVRQRGGSSLLVNLIGMGILLNVSQHASARSRRRDDDAAGGGCMTPSVS